MSVEETISKLESHYKWMKISKLSDGTYRVQDMRFGPIPFNIWKQFITESELMELLKWHIEGMNVSS